MAGKNIKGITVQIGGDTLDLQEALKDVNSQSKSLQTELNLVNKALKFDPNNAVLLAQKQDILEEKITSTRAALERLQSVQSQLEQQAAQGTLGADKYRAYQREVETTKSVLNRLEQQLDDVKTAQNNMESAISSTDTAAAKKDIDKLTTSVQTFEKESNSVSLSQFKSEVDGVKDSATKLKDTLKETASGIGAGIGAAGTTAVAAIKSYDSLESAMNAIQAATGLSESKIQSLKGTVENLYNDNFGESLEDVASVIANVVQTTGEVDPTNLESTVRNLYALQDTFDMDISETLRGANSLITNFGMSGQEAFNLIASGAQQGLNYSGELTDNLSEYAQIWSQAGFSASEMFAILDNGTESGAYNLDKINDFVKEFTISLADGRIEENLDSFSSGTQKLFKKWKDGKATAADVFYSVINDLATAENKQTALTTASNVWSALGEDNALKVITSLNKVNGKFDNVSGTMEKINDVKYDDAGNSLKALGRKAETEILNPLIEDYYPQIKEVIEFVSENLDDLEPILEGIVRQVGILYGSKKAGEIAQGVMQLYKSYQMLKSATDAATTSQKLLNLAQNSNVIGVIIGLVGTLANVFVTLKDSNNDASTSTDELTQKQEALRQKTEDLKKANEDFVTSRNEISSNVNSEFQYYSDLKEELDKIVDANGKIKQGYEDRADFILNKLEDVTGLEIEKNGDVITNYQNLSKEIDKVIEKKKAEAMLSAYDSNYSEAQKGLYGEEGAETGYINAKLDYEDTLKEYEEAVKKDEQLAKGVEYYAYDKGYIDSLDADYDEYIGYLGEWSAEADKAHKNAEKLKADLATAKSSLSEWEKKYVNYKSTIANYDELSAAIAEENTDKINEALNKLQYGFITAKNGTAETLKAQTEDYKKRAKEMQKAVDNGAEGITQSQVDALNDLAKKSQQEYDKVIKSSETSSKKATASTKKMVDDTNAAADNMNFSGKVKTDLNAAGNEIDNQSMNISGKMGTLASGVQKSANIGGWVGIAANWINGLIGGIFGKNTEVENAGKQSAQKAKRGTGLVSFFSNGASAIGGFISGIFSRSTDSENAGKQSAQKAKGGTGLVSFFSSGASAIGSFISGIFSRNTDSEDAGKKSANKAKSGAESVSIFSVGSDFVQGFINGIQQKIEDVKNAAINVGKNALNSLKSFLGINSPSKETAKFGDYYVEGFVNQLNKNRQKVQSAAKKISDSALNELSAPIKFNFNGNMMSAARSNSGSVTNSTTNNKNLNYNANVNITVNSSGNIDVDKLSKKVSENLAQELYDNSTIWG